ncbi:E3 ubiquitin-protein ligase RNF181-like [Dioscorea cayenensis subsp. rotundata]|uniref:E3 ubiquitin-protein ligase RNF181-like n=1 Tax=Dioscorea cayennensis subsp. rotundata TaxID=55577 RepID=A0AB40B263_DIOCR|nr:E3 ubiquitin-protein ligase RNF181-like [Dioscorea cayenensis subsp. rotundata]
MPFITSKSSAEDALRNMFLNTRTWNDMVISETCSEMRESMFSELSESIFSFLIDRVFEHEVSEIVFEIDVEKERVLTVDDIPEEEYDFLEYLVDSIDHELDEIEDLVDSINYDLHEQDSEYSCPAPQVLLESMVTEVFHSTEEEGMGCVICLEELVSGTEVKRLPCFHCFHGQCIDRWFQEMDKCPMCRFTLPA